MTQRLSTSIILFVASLTATFTIPVSACFAQSPESIASQAEPEALARGPIHEAFAEQVNFDPVPGITVAKQPPELIDEVPPQVQPEGYNVQWIPGYWAWDDEREDFIWVSGVWRDIPPDRQWVPGYWADAVGGYQWIAGFWALDRANEVEYLPYPPASLERGPTSPQPSVSHYWVTGCWQYHDQRYRWRPGYWVGHRDDWVWTPDHYVWTPRGAVYVRGYWDYPLVRRGVAFAPVYFHAGNRYRDRNYSPSVAINVGNLLFDLFVQPRHHHYYFGDYYGDRYRRAGYQSNFAFHGRSGYDPLFAHYSTHQRRGGVDFDNQVRQWHAVRDRDESQRPPRTFNEVVTRTGRDERGASAAGGSLVESLTDMISNGRSNVRITRTEEQEQQIAAARSSSVLRDLVQQRIAAEVQSDPVAGSPLDDGRGRASANAQGPENRDKRVTTLKLPGLDIDIDANARNGQGRANASATRTREPGDATTENANPAAAESRGDRNTTNRNNRSTESSREMTRGRDQGNRSAQPVAPVEVPNSTAPHSVPPAATNKPKPSPSSESPRSQLNDLLNRALSPPTRTPSNTSNNQLHQQPHNSTSPANRTRDDKTSSDRTTGAQSPRAQTPNNAVQGRSAPTSPSNTIRSFYESFRERGNNQTPASPRSGSASGTNTNQVRPASPVGPSVQPARSGQSNSALRSDSPSSQNRGTSSNRSTQFQQLRSRVQSAPSTRSSSSPSRHAPFSPNSRSRDKDRDRP
ncbi:MAG: YXWGXW repeat-containing protein [Planctomycetaceae bacterium]|nr:YXWGXW repeat-containing protein [Planctomycetaceae bacterium]